MTPAAGLPRTGLLLVPFAVLLALVLGGWSPLLRLDTGLEQQLDEVAAASPVWVAVLEVLTTLGGPGVLVLVLLVVVGALAARGQWRSAVLVSVGWVGSVALNRTVKHLVARERPVFERQGAGASGLSFPSGHAQGIVVVAGLLLVLSWPALSPRARRGAVAVATLLVVTVGVSRLGLGVHFLSDVVAGWSLGAAWVSGWAIVSVPVLRADRRAEVPG